MCNVALAQKTKVIKSQWLNEVWHCKTWPPCPLRWIWDQFLWPWLVRSVDKPRRIHQCL